MSELLTWEDDIFEEKLLEIGSLGKSKNYTSAIAKGVSLLEQCDPNDNSSVLWATGTIVLGYISIANDTNVDPKPGSEAYNNLYKYLKILLRAYNNSPGEMQDQYRQSDVNFKIYGELFELLDKNLPLSELAPPPTKKSGCFIATAVYGSPLAEEVIILKDFRDQRLLNNYLGKWFVNIYYRISPPIADIIAGKNYLKELTKIILIIPLLKVVNKLKVKEN